MNPKVARDVLPLVSNPDFAELIGIYMDEKSQNNIRLWSSL
jgi:hypothetical protein